MSYSPLVTIIVPAYRSSAYLGRCVESVLAQTFEDWELILVEQSGAGTPEREQSVRIMRSFQEADTRGRIRLIEQENEGASGGRNRGIEEARGAYLAFLDADDEYLPHKLQRQVELFRLRPDVGLVYGDYEYVDLSGTRHASVFDALAHVARDVPSEPIAPGLRVCAPNLFDFLARQYFIATITGMVRREVLGSDIRFDARFRYAEEWLFYLEIVRRTRAGFVDAPLCLHHHVHGSVSRTSSARNLEDLAHLLEHLTIRWPDASRAARRAFRRQLAHARRQLGLTAFKHRRFAVAAGHFSMSLRAQVDGRTVVHLFEARLRARRARLCSS